jgi:hypothetical protein
VADLQESITISNTQRRRRMQDGGERTKSFALSGLTASSYNEGATDE